MKHTLKEHDVIIKDSQRTEEKVYRMDGDTFMELSAFIKDCDDSLIREMSWSFGMLPDVYTDDDFEGLDSFFSIRSRKKYGGDYIVARNYVGLIQLPSGAQIEILPKVDLSEDNDDELSRDLFIRMVRSLNYGRFKVAREADLDIEKNSLFEWFASLYLNQVWDLIRKGLRSRYVETEGNLKYFSGKLLVSKHIAQNAAHGEQFYMAYDEYTINCSENRLIKSAVNLLRRDSVSHNNIRIINQITAALDDVEESWDYETDFKRAQVSLDRLTRDRYESVLEWTMYILRGNAFTPFSSEKARPKGKSILFNMHDLYETYIFNEFRKNLAAIRPEWHAVKQGAGQGKYLFEKYDLGNEEKETDEKGFHLKPDILVKQEEKNIAILDTKWKRLYTYSTSERKKKNFGISNADMYQMYVYARKFNVNHIWLIYPRPSKEEWTARDENDMPLGLTYKSISPEPMVCVTVFFVDVEKIEDSMSKLINEICSVYEEPVIEEKPKEKEQFVKPYSEDKEESFIAKKDVIISRMKKRNN